MDMMTRQKLKAWPNADWEQVEVLCGSMSNERASELMSRMQVIMMERVDEKLGAMAECTDRGGEMSRTASEWCEGRGSRYAMQWWGRLADRADHHANQGRG